MTLTLCSFWKFSGNPCIRILVVASLFWLFPGSLSATIVAQEYNSNSIPDSLKINANAIVREDITEFIYQSAQNSKLKVWYAVTVLNSKGDPKSVIRIYHDRLRKLTSFRGNIFDAEGKLIRKIKNSELTEINESAGYPDFSDFYSKYFNPLISEYPYTVEYEYEIEYSGSYFFPDWTASSGFNVSVEKAELKIIVPVDYQFHYKQYNFSGEPEMQKEGESIKYIWTASNIKARDNEPYIGSMNQYAKTVYTAPSDFELEGFSGKMNSWNDLAEWFGRLNEGRDALSENTCKKIMDMIKNVPDERSKVKIIYGYLQERTRYFSIQLGIGGLQPMEARVVDEVGYGDCKGLVNYMKAMLKVAGVKSYYCLVESGKNFPQIEADFPSDQFNHIILCVPLQKDTVWLECTNQTIPFGFLGDFTSDRHVLLIRENGGELARTPVYSIRENFQETYAKITLVDGGNASIELSRKLGGLQHDDVSGYLNAGADEQKKWLYNYIDLPGFKIDRFEFKQSDADKPESFLKMSLNAEAYGSVSGKRIFMPLNHINRQTYVPPKLKNRWSNIEKRISYFDMDSVEFVVPGGYEIEFLPGNTFLNSPFGSYESRVSAENNRIMYYRQIKMYKGVFGREHYGELVKFYYDINIADKVQAILTKK